MKTLPKPRAGAERHQALAPRAASASPSPTPRAPSPAPRPARHWLTGAFLPAALCLLFIGIHLTGLALLNWESARRAWLEKAVQRLQQRNEALRARLNAISAEPLVQRWAEARGMVRAETQEAQTIQVRQAVSGKWRVASSE